MMQTFEKVRDCPISEDVAELPNTCEMPVAEVGKIQNMLEYGTEGGTTSRGLMVVTTGAEPLQSLGSGARFGHAVGQIADILCDNLSLDKFDVDRCTYIVPFRITDALSGEKPAHPAQRRNAGIRDCFKAYGPFEVLQHWSSWPEHQRLALPLWIYTRDQNRAGQKDDMTRAVTRTLVELSKGLSY